MAKKRKTTTSKPIQGAPPTSTRVAANGNSSKGLLFCPVELQTEILDYFPAVGPTTRPRGRDDQTLGGLYSERTDVLRCLSQVSLDYRRVFLPSLYETLNLCIVRKPGAFYKIVGEELRRMMQGLRVNPELASCVRTVNVVLTRYQTGELIPLFSSTIATFQNLHTLHVIHAHTQMTTALKLGFEGVTLPAIRVLIIPGYCHEILKCCPKVKSVWGTWRDDASKVVTVIAKHCKEVEEMRGFRIHETNTLKRLIKAAPGLKTIGLDLVDFESNGELGSNYKTMLPSFPKLCEMIIRIDRDIRDTHTDISRATNKSKATDKPKATDKSKACIKSAKAFMNNLPPRSDRLSLRLWHVRNDYGGSKPFYVSVDLTS